MKLGYIVSDAPGAADRKLTEFARQLEVRGYRLAGTVQTNSPPDHGGRCDMDVRVLGGGPVIRISQSLGPGSRGCRLDTAALEQAVAQVALRLDDKVDLVLINKFGKHEAEGRGFRPVIAEALERDLPVLIAVNALNLGSFLEFTCGVAEKLSLDLANLERWLANRSRVAAA